MDHETTLEIAAAVDQTREIVNAIVAALREDGFTDREARIITAAIFQSRLEESEGGQPDA